MVLFGVVHLVLAILDIRDDDVLALKSKYTQLEITRTLTPNRLKQLDRESRTEKVGCDVSSMLLQSFSLLVVTANRCPPKSILDDTCSGANICTIAFAQGMLYSCNAPMHVFVCSMTCTFACPYVLRLEK